MKLHTTPSDGLNLFTAYGHDHVAINHSRYASNLIVLPERIITDWQATAFDTLSAQDMGPLLELGVGIILLGTGRRLRFPPPSLLSPFARAGIGIEIMDLQAACRTYNILAGEGRQVAAALLFDPAETD